MTEGMEEQQAKAAAGEQPPVPVVSEKDDLIARQHQVIKAQWQALRRILNLAADPAAAQTGAGPDEAEAAVRALLERVKKAEAERDDAINAARRLRNDSEFKARLLEVADARIAMLRTEAAVLAGRAPGIEWDLRRVTPAELADLETAGWEVRLMEKIELGSTPAVTVALRRTIAPRAKALPEPKAEAAAPAEPSKVVEMPTEPPDAEPEVTVPAAEAAPSERMLAVLRDVQAGRKPGDKKAVGEAIAAGYVTHGTKRRFDDVTLLPRGADALRAAEGETGKAA